MKLTLNALPDSQVASLKGKSLDRSHYKVLVDQDEDVLGVRPDGTLQFKVLRNRIDHEMEKTARRIFRFASSPGSAAERKVASGFQKDPGASSIVMGYFDRSHRQPFCRPCSFNIQHPELFDRLRPYIGKVDEVFRGDEDLKEFYEIQQGAVSKTVPDWIIKDTPFTTITVNRNWRTYAHPDEGNLAGGFSAMTCMTSGMGGGGELIFPKFECAIQVRNGDILYADTHHLHGNTEFLAMAGMYERITAVFYFRDGMTQGLPKAEEIEYAKQLRR
jgi:hypothetical protein